MKFFSNRFVVLVDTNVLFSFRKRDILLRFSKSGLFRARWSSEILEELKRNINEKRPHLIANIEQQIKILYRDFPHSLVTGYENLTTAIELPDEKDRHVLAAAIRCGAQLIITENLKDFPNEILECYHITAISADDFLSGICHLYPIESVAILKKLRESYQNPPYNVYEFIMDLNAKGLPKVASIVRSQLDLL